MMTMYKDPHPLGDYLDTPFVCDCGKEHYASLKHVSIRQGALEDLPVLAKKLGFKSLYLISDSNTYAVAGERCMELLDQAGVKARIAKLTHIGFDEATVGELFINMPDDCDLMVSVGSGSINDMTRYFSYRMHRPFFSVATAPSMDGFASSWASLFINKLKTSIPCQTPMVIIGDVDVLKEAPYHLIAAGLGDMLGKTTCLNDWKLSRIINGEHYCKNVVGVVENCADKILANADKAKDRDPKVISDIIEGLVMTGVAMSLYGDSRPASGCEHQMSHYWEMVFEQAGKKPAFHGTQVGVGTVLVLKMVEKLLKVTVDFDAARAAAPAYDPVKWEAEVRQAYGNAADGVIAMEEKAQKNETKARLKRIDAIEANWEEITSLLKALPSSDTVAGVLKSLNAAYLPEQIDVDKTMLKNTLMYCKEVRARYTFLQMLWDLNLLDAMSDAVIS